MMNDGWRRITCEESDRLMALHGDCWGVTSSLTDLGGQFGEPEVYTEWGDRDTERPMLRNRRYPQLGSGGPDRKPCEHWARLIGVEDDDD